MRQTLMLEAVQMLHVFRRVFAKRVASSRETSAAPLWERRRELTNTARATVSSCAIPDGSPCWGGWRRGAEELMRRRRSGDEEGGWEGEIARTGQLANKYMGSKTGGIARRFT